MNKISKVFNYTRQQQIDFIQAKFRIQCDLGINNLEWGNIQMAKGEDFVQRAWGDVHEDYRKRILTDDTLGFWVAFRYEWGKDDVELLKIINERGKRITHKDSYIMYKDALYRDIKIAKNIIYQVSKY